MAEKEHGTKAGYLRHRRANEVPCAKCKAAWAAYYRIYRSKR